MSESSRSLPSARHLLRRGRRRAPRSRGSSPASTPASAPTRCCAPLYPEDDWDGAEARLRLFLEQYWGGPDDLLRGARPPAAADAARAVRHRRGRARRVADATCGTPSTRSSCPPSRTRRCGVTWRWRRAACRTASRDAGGDLAPTARRPPCSTTRSARSPVHPEPTTADRARLVAGRRLLPGLHPQLRRRERRRRRRPRRHPRAGCRTWPTSASTPSGSRRSTPRRWPTTATTSPTPATSSRSSATSPSSTRCSPRRTRWACG